MPDLGPFYACFFGACPLLIFGLAELVFLATRERFAAEAEQFSCPELSEASHAVA